MAWDDTKSNAVDSDNPTSSEQITATEYNAQVTDQKNRVLKAGDTMSGDLNFDNNSVDNLKTAQFNSEIDNGSKSASFDITLDNAQKQKVTLTANTMTATLLNPTSVGNFQVKIVNGGLATLTWAITTGSIFWPGGTAPTLTASGTDIISFYYDGTNAYGVDSLDFS